MKKFIDKYADKLGARFALLVLVALAGIGMFRCFREAIYCVLGAFSKGADGKLIPIAAIDGVLLGLPVFVALWWFRTRDTHAQINKSQAQIHQNNLAIGLDKLVSGDSLQLAIGVQMLIQVSKNTKEFNEEIRLAFIKRLQHLPDDIKYHDGNDAVLNSNRFSIQLPTLNHMPHIFDWLVQHAEQDDNDIDIERAYIDVPEMYFEIEELESTKDFIDSGLSGFAKEIPLREIRDAFEKYLRTQLTIEAFGEAVIEANATEA